MDQFHHNSMTEIEFLKLSDSELGSSTIHIHFRGAQPGDFEQLKALVLIQYYLNINVFILAWGTVPSSIQWLFLSRYL